MVYYPKQVEEQLSSVINAAKMHNLNVSEESMHDVFGDFLFQKWLSGDEDYEDLQENAPQLIKRAIALDIFNNAVKKDYVDVIDSDGEEFAFLTGKGKEYFKVSHLKDVDFNTLIV